MAQNSSAHEPALLEKFFEKDEHAYRIKKALREQLVFAPQNLLNDPPFSRLDIVSCRNLLIYLELEAQGGRKLAISGLALCSVHQTGDCDGPPQSHPGAC